MSTEDFDGVVERILSEPTAPGTKPGPELEAALSALIRRARPFCTGHISGIDDDARDVVTDFLGALIGEDVELGENCVTYMEARIATSFSVRHRPPKRPARPA